MGLFGLKVGSNRHSHAHDQQQPQHQHQNQLPGLGSYPLHRPLHPQQHLPPPGINHLHKRSETTNSYTESDFLSTGSSSSYTSTESIGYHLHPQHTKPSSSPRPMKKVPLALRPNLDMLVGAGQSRGDNFETLHNGPQSDHGISSQPPQTLQQQAAHSAPARQMKREDVARGVAVNQKQEQPQQAQTIVPPKQRSTPRKPLPQAQTPDKLSYANSQPVLTPKSSTPQDIDLNITPTFGTSANVSQQSLPRSQPGGQVNNVNTPRRSSGQENAPQVLQQDISQYYNQGLYFKHQQSRVNPVALETTKEVDDAQGEDDELSEDDDSETTSTGSFQPTQHPYYEQWKRYYQALALQQQQHQQQQQQRNSVYFQQNDPQFASQYNQMMPYGYPQMPPQFPNNGMNYMMQQQHQQYPQFNQEMQSQVFPNSQLQQSLVSKQRRRSSQTPHSQSLQNLKQQQDTTMPGTFHESNLSHLNQQPHDYLQAYQRTMNVASDNVIETDELVRNSRKSTIKSARSISEPQHAFKKPGSGNRIASLESNFKPQTYNVYSDSDEEVEEPSVNVNDYSEQDSNFNQQMSNLVLSVDKDESSGSRQISDYTKYLFDDDDDDESAEKGNDQKDEAQEEPNETIIADRAPSPVVNHTPMELNRKDTTSSEDSYNSIQKEENFQVAPYPSSTTSKLSPTTPLKQKKGKKAQVQQDGSPSTLSPQQSELTQMPHPWQLQTNFDMGNNMSMSDLNMMPQTNPIMSMQMPMNVPQHMMMPYNNMNMMAMNMGMGTGMGMGMGMNPMMYQNGAGYPAMNRHSMMMMMPQDSRRQSMMMYDHMPYANKRNSMPVGWHGKQHSQPKLDAETRKRIKEFRKLRGNIASGNKTMEYRLLWTKMLITATNFKLYNYINLKGDFIPQQSQPQQIENNKAAFIKASVTHITKIITEIESGNDEIKTSLKCKAYFIYACLLKNDFVESYEQDFGIDKNVPSAIKYFNKVLDLNRRDPRVLYKMGEIYEYDISDEDMSNMVHANGGIDEVTNAIDNAIEYYTNSAQYGYERAEAKLAKFGITIESI